MKTIAKKLRAQGAKADDHHATLKKLYKAETGETLPKDALQDLRDAIQTADEQPEKKAVPWDVDRYHEAHPDREHVRKVLETSERHGRPTRLLIACTVEGCKQTREVFAQDAFQVKRCWEHRATKWASNNGKGDQ